jgi:hypothetical protein
MTGPYIHPTQDTSSTKIQSIKVSLQSVDDKAIPDRKSKTRAKDYISISTEYLQIDKTPVDSPENSPNPFRQGNHAIKDDIEETFECYSDSFEDIENEILTKIDDRLNLAMSHIESQAPIKKIDKDCENIYSVSKVGADIEHATESTEKIDSSQTKRKKKVKPEQLKLSNLNNLESVTAPTVEASCNLGMKLTEKTIYEIISDADHYICEKLNSTLNSENYESPPEVFDILISFSEHDTEEVLLNMIYVAAGYTQESINRLFKLHVRYDHPHRPLFVKQMLKPRPITKSKIIETVKKDMYRLSSHAQHFSDADAFEKQELVVGMNEMYDLEVPRVEILLQIAEDMWNEMEHEAIQRCIPVFE